MNIHLPVPLLSCRLMEFVRSCVLQDPLEACHAVVQAAYELWLQYEIRTDDITIICIYVDSTGEAQTSEERPPLVADGLEVRLEAG